MKAAVLALVITGLLTAGFLCRADEFVENPQMSFFVGVDLGMGFDVDEEARSPVNHLDEKREAYTLGSFVFGLTVGYRFNEVIGVEGGWHEQRHKAHPEWGGFAGYQEGHLALRLAWPLPTRQTPVLRVGPAIGRFAYGEASSEGTEENSALVLGGLAGLTMEHEFVLGIVGTLALTYMPIYRFGMDGVLELEEYDWYEGSTEFKGSKDFTEGRLIHIMCISMGVQFEWTFR